MTPDNVAKDPAAVALGARGGRANTEAQRAARSAALKGYWAEVRAGLRPHPRRKPPTPRPD